MEQLFSYPYGEIGHKRIRRENIRRAPSGKYFVAIVCETEIKWLPAISNNIGVDVGLKNFAITSDADAIGNQLCSEFGYKNLAVKDLPYGHGFVQCAGAEHDRDVNAAKKLLKLIA